MGITHPTLKFCQTLHKPPHKKKTIKSMRKNCYKNFLLQMHTLKIMIYHKNAITITVILIVKSVIL